MRGACGMLFRGYRGCLDNRSVLGRWNVVDVRTLRCTLPLLPFNAAFFACLALASCGLLDAAAFVESVVDDNNTLSVLLSLKRSSLPTFGCHLCSCSQ